MIDSISKHAWPAAIPVTPQVKELVPAPAVEEALFRFRHLPSCLLLESSLSICSSQDQPLGRYSFLMADPCEILTCPVGTQQPLEKSRLSLARFQLQPIPDLPPFQGGMAGLLSYDLGKTLTGLPDSKKQNDSPLPAVALGCYDALIAWDHQQQRAWIISTGIPETEPSERNTRAKNRIEQFYDLLNSDPIKKDKLEVYPTNTSPTSNFSKTEYLSAVQKCIDYIRAGDLFQVNLSQQLSCPTSADPVDLYLQMREHNPAPFSGYFDLSEFGIDAQIISASPERFFSIRDRMVETRPIKGTRPRVHDAAQDAESKKELLASSKDRAENTMIVDLMRNDLSRCCEDDSIQVTQWCGLETYPTVLHLVSAVQGRLRDECDPIDIVEALFPGGSITGAPKIRAMEIIDELEPNERGAYCGSMGYLGFDGNADFNILIRTITSNAGQWHVPVGGGIVYQSDPELEHEETLVKAAGMLQAIAACQQNQP